MKKKILIAAGGSGGHLFPAQAVAQELESDAEILFGGHGLEGPFFHKKFPFESIQASPFSLKRPLRFVLGTLRGFFQSLLLLRRFAPDVVVGFGSYHTFPLLLAALVLRKKILLFEANAILGKVNRFFAPFAEKVAVQFPLGLKNQEIVSLLPWGKKKQRASREEAYAYFGLEPGRKTILVFGGSQGALFLNEAIPQALESLSRDDLQVIHCTGKGRVVHTGNDAQVGFLASVKAVDKLLEQGEGCISSILPSSSSNNLSSFDLDKKPTFASFPVYKKIPAVIKEFETRMDLAYLIADLVICRSGASTIGEIIRYQKKALLIPFPFSADDHQVENGRFFTENSVGSLLLLQGFATQEVLRESILHLLDNQYVAINFKSLERKPFSRMIRESVGLPNKYHLIGVGGIGMSALARILLQRGAFVQGSDKTETELTAALVGEGVRLNEKEMRGSQVVYSSGIGESHLERLFAKEHQIPLFHRSELLDQLIGKQLPLLIAGTHGKTTTTALLSTVLLEAKLDPSFAVGGIVQALQTNGYSGSGRYFVAEADESDGSFLRTPAFGAIVTNCEEEHMDYWKTKDLLLGGFRQFFAQAKSEDHLFWCKEDENLVSLAPRGFSYGFQSSSDLLISSWEQDKEGVLFSFSFQGRSFEAIRLPLFGRHNVLNGSAVFGLALTLELPEEAIRRAFLSFRGVKRRTEKKGERDGVVYFDDYGHHPTEIQVTLAAIRKKGEGKRLVVVFQPHRFSRTRDLWNSFVGSFAEADLLVMTDIYGASEVPIEGVSAEKLAKEIQVKTGRQVIFSKRELLEETLALILQPGDLCLTLGAGDVTYVAERMLERGRRQ